MIANIFKFILGISLALTILVGGGVATGLYFMNRTSAPPPKPMFANDSPTFKKKNPKAVASKSTTKKSNSQSQSKVEASAQPTPTETPKAEAPKELPPGAYRARVTWPQGLILRAEAQSEAERIGGVGANARIIVLEQNGGWQKIRLVGSDQEGWVKAGNTRKVSEQEDSEPTEQAQ